MIVVKYDFTKLDDSDGDVEEIIKIIQYLDSNIAIDIDILSNPAISNPGNIIFPSRSINITTSTLENGCDDKIDALRSYISRLNLCNT